MWLDSILLYELKNIYIIIFSTQVLISFIIIFLIIFYKFNF